MLACGATTAADAGAYPNKPVRIIVAQPAGGNADLVARTYAQRLVDRFGNRVGIPTVVNFATEAGSIAASVTTKGFDPAAPNDLTEGTATVTFATDMGNGSSPADVAPLTAAALATQYPWSLFNNEPNGVDGQLTLNPRDQLVTIIAMTRGGKRVMNVKPGVEAVVARPVQGDHVAVVGDNRKLLIFPLTDVPEMARGQGVYLQKYKDGGLLDAATFVWKEGLKDENGRLFGPSDLKEWKGERAQATLSIDTLNCIGCGMCINKCPNDVLKQVDGKAMVDLQNQGLKYDPALLWIDDADRQAKWYVALKREWAAARAAARPFKNPVKPTTLRWRS